MELWELVARESARDLVARYNACGDADEIEAMVALFAEDAVMEVGEWGRHEGREAIRAFFAGVRSPAEKDPAAQRRLIRHFTATHCIDVESPEHARGQCYFLVLTHSGLDHWGRYIDRYGTENGSWRFARREVVVDGVTPGGWAEARRKQTSKQEQQTQQQQARPRQAGR
jgi:ketosteroid isomerase-like protein